MIENNICIKQKNKRVQIGSRIEGIYQIDVKSFCQASVNDKSADTIKIHPNIRISSFAVDLETLRTIQKLINLQLKKIDNE